MRDKWETQQESSQTETPVLEYKDSQKSGEQLISGLNNQNKLNWHIVIQLIPPHPFLAFFVFGFVFKLAVG